MCVYAVQPPCYRTIILTHQDIQGITRYIECHGGYLHYVEVLKQKVTCHSNMGAFFLGPVIWELNDSDMTEFSEDIIP
jgi:hypothetical protein